MEIILKKDVENLGYVNDIVNVRPGYAHNFLIPQGYAIAATASAKKVLAENLKQRAHKDEKLVEDARKVVAALAKVAVTVQAKAGANNKIFGAVTSLQVSEGLKAQGFDIEKKDIKIESIKELGSYTANVRLHKEVIAEVKVDVVSAGKPVQEEAPADEAAE